MVKINGRSDAASYDSFIGLDRCMSKRRFQEIVGDTMLGVRCSCRSQAMCAGRAVGTRNTMGRGWARDGVQGAGGGHAAALFFHYLSRLH